jgi:hypothetical protein
MQGDYTRKMQEAAPFRQLGNETGLDVDGLRNAAELYSALQDPNQLVQFHGELTAALQAQGLSPAEATAAATQHVTEVAAGGSGTQGEWVDPEEQRFQGLESRIAQFEQAQAQQQANAEAERMQMALVGEMNRQESLVREQHPDWTQNDIDAIYELAPFYGGMLTDAANRYDEIVSDRVTRILNGKGAVASNPAHAPLPPAIAGVTQPQGFGDDLDAAHKAAMAAARLLP